MISEKYSGLSILLIIALLFSSLSVFVGAIGPIEIAQAASTNVTIITPTGVGDNVTYVRPGGNVPVTYNLGGPGGGDSNGVQITISNSTTTIGSTSVSRASGATYTEIIAINGSAAVGYYNVAASDGHGHTAAQGANSVYVDTTTPTVSVFTANTCWPTSSTQTIYWSATIAGAPSEKFSTVVINWNGSPIQTYTNQSQTTSGSFTYSVGSSGTTGTLSIVATSASGNVANGFFPSSGVVYVLAPGTLTATNPTLPATSFTGGAATTISFNALGTASTNFTYLLALSRPGGTDNITPGWYIPTSLAVSYPWTVSNTVTSTSCYVWVWIKDCAGNVSGPYSSTVFSITCTNCAPTVSISSPTNTPTATTWYTGTSENITWTVSDPLSSATHTCAIFYSLNDNVTWPWTPAIITAQGNTGSSYWATWSIPSGVTSTTNARIYITAQAPGVGSTGAAATGWFNITNITVPPVVTVVSPASTSIWTAGTTQTIGWTVSGTPSTTPMDYKIYLLSGGSIVRTITTLINQSQCPSTSCTYSWAIPTDLSGAYTVRVIASYLVGPGPQEQLPVQADSQQFTILPISGCAYTTQTQNLYPGWNLISLKAMPSSTAITSVLADVLPNVISVWYYPGGSSTWQNYIPAAGSGALTQMVDGKAYWVQMSQTYSPGTFTYQGRPCPCGGSTPLMPYVYVTGWNMVGYKSTVQEPIREYLYGNCGTQYMAPIYTYDGSSQSYTSIACSENLTPGAGYWIYFGVATGITAPCK